MNRFDRVEPRLPELMADLASARVPDYFDDLLQATAHTRQRPAWSSLERWLPMDIALTPASSRARSLAGLGILALVGLLLAATLLAYVGSRGQRVPLPFGPAGNGSLYYSAANGDIYTADPVTGASRLILAGARAEPQAAPSNDGRLIEFGRKATGGDQVMVASADGSNARLLGTYAGFAEVAWSPDDTKLAIVSTVDGVSSLSVVPVDGSAATTLPLGLDVHEVWYLPTGKLAFVGTSKTGAGESRYGIYVVNDDGTGLRAVEPPTSGETDWLGINPSPDGRSLVYHRWIDPGEKGRLHLVDIASGTDTQVPMTGITPGEEHESPIYSPDGKTILFERYGTDDNVRLAVVPVAGGTPISIGPAVHYDVSPSAFFAPDGRSVIAWYPSLKETWLLDPTGNGNDRKLDLPVTDVPTWQRVAP